MTKKTATIWGIGFTLAFLTVFVICEQISRRRHKGVRHEHLEQFNQIVSPRLNPHALGLKHPQPVLVALRSPRSLDLLKQILEATDATKKDVVVLTCKVISKTGDGLSPAETQLDEHDRSLLTQVVNVAEHLGKAVFPLVLPTNNPLHAIALTARDLRISQVVLGVSEKIHADLQLEQFALAWGAVTASTPSVDYLSVDLRPVPGTGPSRETPVPGGLTVRILGPQVNMQHELAW